MARNEGNLATRAKTLLNDKREGLKDIKAVGRIREGKRSDYVTAQHVDSLFGTGNRTGRVRKAR
jgi:hypothetical protein